MIKRNGLTVMNRFGIGIKQCCASCAYKDLTRNILSRYCVKREIDIEPCDVCCRWKMNGQLAMAGLAKGKVKCKEYLMYLKMVRERESLYMQLGQEFEEQTIMEIRAEFESQFGSIYTNF